MEPSESETKQENLKKMGSREVREGEVWEASGLAQRQKELPLVVLWGSGDEEVPCSTVSMT
jgi:hypothetical protein